MTQDDFGPRRKHIEVLRELLPLKGARVADVGCGDGAVARLMTREGARVTGIECGEAQLEKARAAKTVGDELYIYGYGENLPLADASFDIVVYFNALHHVPMNVQGVALREARRILKPAGLLYIQEAVPDADEFAVSEEEESVASAEDTVAGEDFLEENVPPSEGDEDTGISSLNDAPLDEEEAPVDESLVASEASVLDESEDTRLDEEGSDRDVSLADLPASPTESLEADAEPSPDATLAPEPPAEVPSPLSSSTGDADAEGVPRVESEEAEAVVPPIPGAGDETVAALGADQALVEETDVEAEPVSRIVLKATQDCWVQVKNAEGDILLTRVLRPGESYEVPDEPGLTLLTGNAGGLDILVDGRKLPPLGPVGTVKRDISLDPESLLADVGGVE